MLHAFVALAARASAAKTSSSSLSRGQSGDSVDEDSQRIRLQARSRGKSHSDAIKVGLANKAAKAAVAHAPSEDVQERRRVSTIGFSWWCRGRNSANPRRVFLGCEYTGSEVHGSSATCGVSLACWTCSASKGCVQPSGAV